ncbi:MAG: DUF484 family protein [Gallionellaceae bacterium]|nr:DUF484 family protein [Gallionellaceae bacterium]
MNISPEQISEFLKLNPEFFQGHPELLTEITVPHPYSGQAISLGERQVLALRDKSRGLEIKLREFIQFAEENDAIGDKLHKLSLDLMRAKTLEAALQSFYLDLSESFSVPHTVVRIWTANAPDMPEFAKVSVDIQVLVEGLNQPQCGSDVPDEVRAWFGEVGAHQKSFALAPLKEGNLTGLMVLASEDNKRFYPEMGTLYLTWLAQLAGAACARFV